MGPQLDSCGRFFAIMDDVNRSLLQWGRNLTVAEGLKSAPAILVYGGRFNGAAT